MRKPIDKLTHDTYIQYGDRKKLGRISVLVDVCSSNVYPVPKNIEHIQYAPKLKRQHAISYEKLVPAHIDTNGMEITGLSIGYSGLEQKMKVRHTEEDLKKAREIMWDFIRNGLIPVGTLQEDSIASRYVDKSLDRHVDKHVDRYVNKSIKK